MAKSLQQQGVPVPDRLRGPGNAVEVNQKEPSRARARTAAPKRAAPSRRTATPKARRPRTIKSFNADYNPVNIAEKGSNSVGALEAEFLVGLGLLVLLMFSSGASYSDKIMSVMKRGALLCVAFFILALVSSAGPNSAKIAKAFGALLIVAILVTSPVNTVVTDLDSLIKNDWVGSAETGGTGSGNTGSASAQSGTQASTNSLLQQLEQSLINSATAIGRGQSAPSNIGQVFSNAVKNAFKDILP